jgi:hypothetical protein
LFVEKCSDPSKITNARVAGYDIENGQKVEFYCDNDGVLIPANSTKLTCENGQWKGIIPSCKGTKCSIECRSLSSRTALSSVKILF